MRTSSGQSLLESIVAIGVIVTAVLGAMTLIISSITAGRISQSRVEAANFAREGVEIVRSLRDSNWLKFEQNELVGGTIPAWNTGLGNLRNILTYTVGASSAGWTLVDCSSPTPACNATNQNARTGIYKVNTGTLTMYSQYRDLSTCVAVHGNNNCTRTKYSRLISLATQTDAVGSDFSTTYILVESTVSWQDRTGTKSLVARARLYDWK